MDQVSILEQSWRDPLDVARPFAQDTYALLLTTPDGWTYFARDPDNTLRLDGDDPSDAFAALSEGLGPCAPAAPEGPPFQGGWAGLISYEFGARAEPVVLKRHPDWPDLDCGLYRGLLAFHPQRRRLLAIGRGADADAALARALAAAQWLKAKGQTTPPGGAPLAQTVQASSGEAYEAVVGQVTARIAAGEIFQANLARRWQGRLARGATPYDLFERLTGQSPAPFAGYLRLDSRAVVSNSPERFLSIQAGDPRRVLAQPIKGTRPRGATPAADADLARALLADPKDRAENLMIVDLMRNDVARVCRPGSVKVPALFTLESYANVHHLVSTVTGEMTPGCGPADLLRAAFPPGSITGAPKVQAMKVIAELEPPRGPYCGSLFWAGFDGAMDASVLIRTVACVQDAEGWRFEAGAGGGLVADSRPVDERLESEAKIAAILRAMTQPVAAQVSA